MREIHQKGQRHAVAILPAAFVVGIGMGWLLRAIWRGS
jgi:hypothetical protein